MSPSCSFMSASFLSAVLLLQLTLVPVRCSVVEKHQMQSNCSNEATDKCIVQLISEELLPLQHLVTNGSELLKFADRQFVEHVWAYVRGSIKEPITATHSELVALDQTLLFYVTLTLTRQKGNALMDNLRHTKVNVVRGVALLEVERAKLQHYIELNISQANKLSLESEEVLGSSQTTLTELVNLESELNTTLHQLSISVARIQQATSITQQVIRNSRANDTSAMALAQLQSASEANERVKNVLMEVPWMTDGVQRLTDILEKLNGTREEREAVAARARETAEDALQEADELINSMELVLIYVQGVVNIANRSNVAASHLVQNVSLSVEEASRITTEYTVFKERLHVLEAGADTAVEHVLDLLQQVQSITVIGSRFLNEEFLDEFGRLELINETVSQAMAIIDGILNDTWSARELMDSAVDVETSARLLSMQNVTTASLFTLDPAINKLNGGSAQYDLLETTYLDTLQQLISSEGHLSVIEEELSVLMEQFDLFQSSRDSGYEKISIVSSLINEMGLDNITAEISEMTSDAFDSLDQAAANFSMVTMSQLSQEARLLNLSLCLQDISDTQSQLSNLLDRASSLVSATYTFIDQAEVPLAFGSSQTMVITLSPDQLSGLFISRVLRSLSFQFTPSNVSNLALIHLESSRSGQASTEVFVDVFDAHLRVLFKTTTSRGREFFLQLAVFESTLEPLRSYKVVISRTGSNVHIRLTDLLSSELFSVPGVASRRLSNALSASSFLTSATLHVGGASLQSMEETSSNYSGCLWSVELNGVYLNLWSLATDMRQMNLQSCSENYTAAGNNGRVQLSLKEGQIAQQWVNGSFLPVVVEFQTQFPNGLLLYTHSNSMKSVLNSFSVYLVLGHIGVRVRAGDRTRSLTSTQTYNNGALHIINIDLDGSKLVLTTAKELVRKKLRAMLIASLSTYNELLVGGVRLSVGEEQNVKQNNFTGCVSVFSLSSILKAPRCFEQEIVECRYCSVHEAVFSADFYGTSYAVFPTFTATEHLDISLNFRTYFEDGIIMFIGSAAQNMWLLLALIGARFRLLFQAVSNTPYDFPSGVRLSDGSMHSVTIVRSGNSLSVTLDGNTLNFPFGFVGTFFPVGQFPSNLFVGGISRLQRHLLRSGIPWDGFKGYLDSIHVNGRPLDFSENIASEAVSFIRGDSDIQVQNGHEFSFSGSSTFAEFDIGRFAENFSLGFQFNTESESGLLFYVFSKRRDDKMAIQLNQSTLQLYIQDSVSDSEWLVSLSQEVTHREWHNVRITQEGENITVLLDNNLNLQELLTLPTLLRTTSPLYIGGLSSEQRIPVSSSVITENFTGCLRTHYLSLATRHGLDLGSCERPP